MATGFNNLSLASTAQPKASIRRGGADHRVRALAIDEKAFGPDHPDVSTYD